ncbi:hypothetical protein G9A89_017877 [Geosiphon pyriformis]|nr:hypothetical protein G9A89_017877 [Geosiphon pyriformis]
MQFLFEICLPTEILQDIFNRLTTKNDLFSCALVNRQWCQVAVPILWKNILEAKNRIRIVEVFLFCLPEADKESLSHYEIPIPKFRQPVATFNYPSFLKLICLNDIYHDIKDYICSCCKPASINSTRVAAEQIRFLQKILLEYFARNSPKLSSMIIDQRGGLLVPLLVNSELDLLTARITTLKIHWEFNIFPALQLLSNTKLQNIQNLDFDLQNGKVLELFKFIKMQRNLNTLKIKLGYIGYENITFDEISSVITQNSRTLVTLSLNECGLLERKIFDILSLCIKLEVFEIINCYTETYQITNYVKLIRQ